MLYIVQLAAKSTTTRFPLRIDRLLFKVPRPGPLRAEDWFAGESNYPLRGDQELTTLVCQIGQINPQFDAIFEESSHRAAQDARKPREEAMQCL